MLGARLIIALSIIGLLAGCAGTARNVERSYVRENLGGVPLKSIDVVVFVSGPPRIAEQTLDVKTFEPPERDQPLFIGAEDIATREAMAASIVERLQSAGFAVRLIRSSAGGEPAKIIPLPPPNTSTTAANTLTATAVAPGDRLRIPTPTPSGSATQLALDSTTTLRSLSESSQADAILVVRAVPVDTFSIDFGTGTRVEVSGLGDRPERVQDIKPVEHQGRLMLGQAFLFDRRTGLRLWTKQVPDFPEDGRLTRGHPFLAYGFVHDPQKGAAPSPDARARLAATNFSTKMLADFPKPTEGSAATRAELDQIDVDRESAIEQFFDRGHLAIEVGPRWAFENAELELQLAGQGLPALETGAIAPAGAFALAPRASYLAPGGFLIAVELDLGIAPGSFSRSYFRENLAPNEADPDDRGATVRIEGVTTYGVEATAGIALPLSPRVFVVPSAGPFLEIWSVDAGPSTVIGDPDRTRVGLRGGIDLWLRSDAEGGFYGRIGAGLKAGLDTGGPLVAGGQIGASLGVFL